MIGFLYGLGLAVIGILLTAAGHGTYILLGIASAPVSFLGIIFSIAGPPIFWALVWVLLTYKTRTPQRLFILCILVVHYASIPFVLFFPEYVEEKYFDKVWQAHPNLVVFGALFYIMGQGLLWIYFWMGKSEVLAVTDPPEG